MRPTASRGVSPNSNGIIPRPSPATQRAVAQSAAAGPRNSWQAAGPFNPRAPGGPRPTQMPNAAMQNPKATMQRPKAVMQNPKAVMQRPKATSIPRAGGCMGNGFQGMNKKAAQQGGMDDPMAAMMAMWGMGGGGGWGGGGGGANAWGVGGGGGAAKASKTAKPNAAGVGTTGANQEYCTWVCAQCKVKINGEISVIEHANGSRHKAAAKGQPIRFLPNSSGIIPQLSPRALRELWLPCQPAGAKASPSPKAMSQLRPEAKAKAALKPQQPMGVAKLGFAGNSENILMRALQAGGPVRAPSSASSSAANGEQQRDSYRRKREAAFVPSRAPGNRLLAAARESLPVLSHREEILKAIEANQVIIVEGETGCGKTTQVCQYIVEDAAENGRPCSVVCTQPRRISAISVSERVAEERGERLGGSVGYSVRLENKQGPQTCLLFCTTGILLRRLESDTELEGTTHVLVDEVHERGVESDFLLLAMRDLCRRRSDLKVVLMSATIDKELFGSYFGGAPSITVPGRTFPVEDIFLEDALQATKHVINPSAGWAKGATGGDGGTDKSIREDLDAPKREDLSQLAVRSRYSAFAPNVQAALCSLEQDKVNYDLLKQLIVGDTLARLGKGDAVQRPTGVLVFMSGAKEIETMQDMLWQTPEFRAPPARQWVLPLHGGLPTEDQKKVFQKPPPGIRKIVLATNVAETAITINDIGYVVDSCRMKENRYDAIKGMTALEDTVVSRTNARQRRGRAGRVAPGLCVHAGLSRYRHDTLIDDHQPPEVQRTPLEQLVLRIHATGLHLNNTMGCGKAANICTQLLEPPKPTYVAKAVELLVRLGALDVEPGTGKESLTVLGGHLAHLPLDVRLGKLALYGAAFGPVATDAALTVAAALTSRTPFLCPLESRVAAKKAKLQFAQKYKAGPVGLSDHMAVLCAYQEWDNLPPGQRWDFTRVNFLAQKTLQGMADLKRSLLEALSEAGFVKRGLKAKEVSHIGYNYNGSDGVLIVLTEGFSKGTDEPCTPALVAALLCAALFPQVAQATVPQAIPTKKGKNQDVPKPRLEVRDAETAQPIKVKIHPNSVAAQEEGAKLSSPYLVYQELVKGNYDIHIRDVTPVPPLALAFFGSSLKAANKGIVASPTADKILLVDGWIKLSVSAKYHDAILEARKRLDAILAGWVGSRHGAKEPSTSMQQGAAQLLRAVVQLLSVQEETAPATAPLTQGQQKELQQRLGAGHGKKNKWSKGSKSNNGAAFGGFGGASGASMQLLKQQINKCQAFFKRSAAMANVQVWGGAAKKLKR